MYMATDKAVSICCVGDISLGDSPKMLGIGVRKVTQLHGGDFLFSKVKDKLKGDLIFGNLEGVLSDSGYNPKRLKTAQLRGLPSMPSVLKRAGFNVLNVANNHMMQYGPKVFRETLDLLELENISVVGVKGEGEWHCEPLYFEIKGQRIGILGYSNSDSYGYEPLYALNCKEQVLKDISRIRENVDTLIVSMHWGDEFIRCPSKGQRDYARELIEAGCDLILGHHPHVIQGVERLANRWICYSLGNFISDMVWNHRTLEGVVPTFLLFKGEIRLDDLNVVKIGANFVPTMMSRSLSSIEEHVAPDENIGRDTFLYKKNVLQRTKENRNFSHLYLLKNAFNFTLGIYLQIWAKSVRSFLGLLS